MIAVLNLKSFKYHILIKSIIIGPFWYGGGHYNKFWMSKKNNKITSKITKLLRTNQKKTKKNK